MTQDKRNVREALENGVNYAAQWLGAPVLMTGSDVVQKVMLTPVAGTVGDVNGDGNVDVGDIMAVINLMASKN